MADRMRVTSLIRRKITAGATRCNRIGRVHVQGRACADVGVHAEPGKQQDSEKPLSSLPVHAYNAMGGLDLISSPAALPSAGRRAGFARTVSEAPMSTPTHSPTPAEPVVRPGGSAGAAA